MREADVKTLFKLVCSLLFVLLGFLCSPGEAFAQGYGTIRGTVTDANGAVVPDAAVTATQTGTGRTTPEGTYVFPSQITSTTPQNADITNDPRIAQLSLKLVF
jgi:hypothetical protein